MTSKLRMRFPLIWLVFLAILMLWSYWLSGYSVVGVIIQNLVYVWAPLTAVWAGLAATHTFGGGKPGYTWFIFTLGLAGWATGEVLWVYYDVLVHAEPYPSLADVFYLLAYPLLAIGLIFSLRNVQVQWRKVQPVIWFLCILIGVLLLGITSYFGVYQAYVPTDSFVNNIVAISYGVGDVVLLWITLLLLAVLWELRGGKLAKPWLVLVCAFTLTYIADILFAIAHQAYDDNVGLWKSSLDTLWITAYLGYSWALVQVRDLIVEVQTRARQAKSSKV